MTMVSSGPISLGGTATTSGLNQSVNVELGRSGTASINMNESAVRTLAAVPSGAISMSNFYGKSNRVSISFTFSSNTADASLNLSSIGGYRAGTSDITVTINSGVYLWASSTGGYGLNLTGGTSGDTLTVVNNGFIMGKGGDGARDSQMAGGPAINLGFGFASCTFNNTNGSAYIGGGGGSGGSGWGPSTSRYAGGGGAGGGNGGASTIDDKGTRTSSGGAGGGIGSPGASSTSATSGITGSGGGGRIFPGSGGSGDLGSNGGGAGGGGAARVGFGALGGVGGSSNNAGGAAPNSSNGAGGGGGWGASGGSSTFGGAAGGKAVNLNGKSITWTSGNTTRVWGSVS